MRKTRPRSRRSAARSAEASVALCHDLRTPLTAIRSCSEVLIDHPDMPGDHRTRFLGAIHEEALRLERSVERILRLAESEPGGLAEPLARALRDPRRAELKPGRP